MNLLQELRYRNVFRVAAAYAVVGWLLAQVADLVVDAFNLPDAFTPTVAATHRSFDSRPSRAARSG